MFINGNFVIFQLKMTNHEIITGDLYLAAHKRASELGACMYTDILTRDSALMTIKISKIYPTKPINILFSESMTLQACRFYANQKKLAKLQEIVINEEFSKQEKRKPKNIDEIPDFFAVCADNINIMNDYEKLIASDFMEHISPAEVASRRGVASSLVTRVLFRIYERYGLNKK